MGTNRFDKLFATLKSISSFNTASQQFSNIITCIYLFTGSSGFPQGLGSSNLTNPTSRPNLNSNSLLQVNIMMIPLSLSYNTTSTFLIKTCCISMQLFLRNLIKNNFKPFE